jgi:hypothetical protein
MTSTVQHRLRTAAALLLTTAWLAAIGLGGCNRPRAATASPRAAAKAYLLAMVGGDEASVRAATAGDEPSAKVLVAQAAQNAAYERYAAAAKKAYGQDAAAAFVGRRADDHDAARLAKIDADPEVVTGDTAVVGEGKNRLYLVKIDGAWKVDRSRHVMPGLTDASVYVEPVNAMRRAYETVAAEVEAGRHASAQNARQALLERTEQELRKVESARPASPATTRAASSATRPATLPI